MKDNRLLSGVLIFAVICVIATVFLMLYGLRYTKDVSLWKTYSDKQYGFSFKYPPEYGVSTGIGTTTQNIPYEVVSVINPSNGSIIFSYTNDPGTVKQVFSPINYSSFVQHKYGGGDETTSFDISSQTWVALPAHLSTSSSLAGLIQQVNETLVLPQG